MLPQYVLACPSLPVTPLSVLHQVSTYTAEMRLVAHSMQHTFNPCNRNDNQVAFSKLLHARHHAPQRRLLFHKHKRTQAYISGNPPVHTSLLSSSMALDSLCRSSSTTKPAASTSSVAAVSISCATATFPSQAPSAPQHTSMGPSPAQKLLDANLQP